MRHRVSLSWSRNCYENHSWSSHYLRSGYGIRDWTRNVGWTLDWAVSGCWTADNVSFF